MNTIRLIKKHAALAEMPRYYFQTRSIWWPFWVTQFWGIDEAKMRKAYDEFSLRPTKDIVEVLASE